jgi:hypothetical protein
MIGRGVTNSTAILSNGMFAVNRPMGKDIIRCNRLQFTVLVLIGCRKFMACKIHHQQNETLPFKAVLKYGTFRSTRLCKLWNVQSAYVNVVVVRRITTLFNATDTMY